MLRPEDPDLNLGLIESVVPEEGGEAACAPQRRRNKYHPSIIVNSVVKKSCSNFCRIAGSLIHRGFRAQTGCGQRVASGARCGSLELCAVLTNAASCCARADVDERPDRGVDPCPIGARELTKQPAAERIARGQIVAFERAAAVGRIHGRRVAGALC